MPNAVTTPADMAAAISDIVNFAANDLAWSTTYAAGSGVGTVQVPARNAIFTLTPDSYSWSNSSQGASLDFEVLKIDVSGVATPWQTGVNWIKPITRLYLHGGNSPEPWLLITFESAPGYFHHAFIGYANKLGAWAGGAIADGTSWEFPSSGSSQRWDYTYTNLLFSGFTAYRTNPGGVSPGAMEVDSPEAAFDTYHFCRSSTGAYAGGGWGDGYTTLLSSVAATSIDGTTPIHPVTLFGKLDGGMSTWTTPLGTVPGLRMVNMDYFTPAQLAVIAGENWRIFPLCTTNVGYGEVASNPAATPGTPTLGSRNLDDTVFGGGTESLGLAVYAGT